MYIYIEYICLCTSTIIHNLTYIYHILYEYIIHHYICLKCTNRLTSRIEVSSEMRAKSNGGGSLETTFEAWEKFAKRLGRFGMFFFGSISPELLFANLLGIMKRQHLSPWVPENSSGVFFSFFVRLDQAFHIVLFRWKIPGGQGRRCRAGHWGDPSGAVDAVGAAVVEM